MTELPDFLRLPDGVVAREKQRQERLRQDFNSRAQLSPAEVEAGRAQALIPSLEQGLKNAKTKAEKQRFKDQLAEAWATVGFFVKAAEIAENKTEQEFYTKASVALKNKECACIPAIQNVNGTKIQLPKYRTIKEINSISHGQFGHLVECSVCGNWTFIGSSPIPNAPPDTPDTEVLRA